MDFTSEEIQRVMFSIDGKKSPGPDGYTSHFFKAAWDVVGSDFMPFTILEDLLELQILLFLRWCLNVQVRHQ